MSHAVLLEEATSEQLLEQLKKCFPDFVFAGNISGHDQEFYTMIHGGYLYQWGLVRCLESKMRYHDYMCLKDEFEDDPNKYFSEE